MIFNSGHWTAILNINIQEFRFLASNVYYKTEHKTYKEIDWKVEGIDGN